jgi:hypothetical protein
VVTRRGLLVGSASTLAFGALGPAALAAVDRSTARAADAAQASLAAGGFAMPFGVFCPVPYLNRAAWGCDESLAAANGVFWPEEWYLPQTIAVHHTGFAPAPNPADTVRQIFQNQTLRGDGVTGGGVGWGDIGYHLLIDSNGVVYEGRRSGDDAYPIFDPSGYYMSTGAHIVGYNTGNIGVCMIGFFDNTLPTQAAQDSLVTVLVYLAEVARINPTGVVHYQNPVNGNTHTGLGITGHLDWAATSCPGNPTFYGQLGAIRQAVAASAPALRNPTQIPAIQPSAQPSPSPSPGSSPNPTPSPAPTQSTTAPAQLSASTQPLPPPPPGGQNTSGVEHGGGDAYVDQARLLQPQLFPTVAPSLTSGASPSPTMTPAIRTSGAVPQVSRTAAAAAAWAGDGPGWALTTTAVGVTLAGAAVGGLLWLRQRRTAVAAAGPSLTLVDEHTVAPVEVDPPTTKITSTVDESVTPSTFAEPAAGQSPQAEQAAAQPQGDSPASLGSLGSEPDDAAEFQADGSSQTDPPPA